MCNTPYAVPHRKRTASCPFVATLRAEPSCLPQKVTCQQSWVEIRVATPLFHHLILLFS